MPHAEHDHAQPPARAPLELESRTFSTDEVGPHLLVTAGVHGDEYEPMAAVRRLMRELSTRAVRGRITLVPIVNQPAHRRAARTAEDQLDLARTCPGSDSGSITERTAAALSRLIRGADYYIDLHTGGFLFDIAPLTGYVLHRDPRILDRQRAMARAFNLPIRWGTNPNLHGRSLSVARDAGIPAIYAEHGGGGGMRSQGIQDYVAGVLNVAALLGLIDGTPEAPRETYIVEDHREQSGHLQIQHPAPRAGFFEPCVALGQVVQQGEPLGQIVDDMGQQSVSVPVAESGVVLFLRAHPIVQTGDCLGGILPILAPGQRVLP